MHTVLFWLRSTSVCMYPKEGIQAQSFEIPNHEACKCEEILTSKSGKKVILAVIYRSPQNVQFIEHIERSLNYVSNWSLPIILVGDFNYDLLKNNLTSRVLTDTFNRQCMDQLVDKPTRIAQGSSTLIDHIWTNERDSRG